MPQEEHQFGQDRFYGAVIATDDTGIEQVQAGFVASHFHGSGRALRDVDNDDASRGGAFQEFDEPRLLGGVARAIGFQNNGAQSFRIQNVADNVLLNTGEEGQDDYIRVVQVMRLQR